MALRRISYVPIIASIVLVLAWTAWTRTHPRTEPGAVVRVPVDATTPGPGPDDDKEVLERGKELFTREWIAGDRRSHAGDGLGPVYNAQSCAACHRLGGIGGAGNNETNVGGPVDAQFRRSSLRYSESEWVGTSLVDEERRIGAWKREQDSWKLLEEIRKSAPSR